ncbi:MAG: transcriptional repressor [Bacilli bacterium]|nr:transcriptional repressor [Bacilli bacterium]
MNDEIFTKHSLKRTHSRIEILSVLEKSQSPLTAEEIFKLLRKRDVDLSTIYRTLNSFVDANIIKKEINNNKENIFSIIKEEDKHILVCTKCHKRVEIAGCPYHEANEKIEQETGFLINDHTTEIYGICPDCQKIKL